MRDRSLAVVQHFSALCDVGAGRGGRGTKSGENSGPSCVKEAKAGMREWRAGRAKARLKTERVVKARRAQTKRA